MTRAKEEICYDCGPDPCEKHSPAALLSGLVNAADLDKMQFDPLTEHVPGLIVEGFTLFVGPPKVGKSWMKLKKNLRLPLRLPFTVSAH